MAAKCFYLDLQWHFLTTAFHACRATTWLGRLRVGHTSTACGWTCSQSSSWKLSSSSSGKGGSGHRSSSRSRQGGCRSSCCPAGRGGAGCQCCTACQGQGQGQEGPAEAMAAGKQTLMRRLSYCSILRRQMRLSAVSRPGSNGSCTTCWSVLMLTHKFGWTRQIV